MGLYRYEQFALCDLIVLKEAPGDMLLYCYSVPSPLSLWYFLMEEQIQGLKRVCNK